MAGGLYRLTLAATLGLCCALAGAAVASPEAVPDPGADGLTTTERFERLVERVRYEQARLHTLAARFEQHKESSLLQEPEASSGFFYFAAPDKVRWEYEKPNPIQVVIEGDRMTTWYRDLGQAERLTVARYSDRILRYMGAANSLEKLLEYFRLTVSFPRDGAPYRMDLAPKFSRVARRLRGMSVWLDPVLFLPVKVRYEEPDGDRTEYRFLDLDVNSELPPGCFDVELPADVKVREINLDRGG